MDKNTITLLEKLCASLNCEACINEPMSRHTTFKIGGNADILVRASGETAVAGLLHFAKQQDIPVTVIGKGSNLLISDAGIRGMVIAVENRFTGLSLQNETQIVCLAGTPLSMLCYFAYRHGLTGLEFAWGIPGSAGGAVFMNAGAYGGEMRDVVQSTRHITRDGDVQTVFREQLDFGYRHSYYSEREDIILSAVFELKKGDRSVIRSAMDDLMNRRKTKQPLEYPSAGSTFKRPEGAYASALIDECGLKGIAVGGAQVSEKHAGFVINKNEATACDVKQLIALIQTKVYESTGYSLECEVKML